MIPLACILAAATASSSLPAPTPPDTVPGADTVHVRVVSADTVHGIVFTSSLSADRRIRLSVNGDSVAEPITTVWLDTGSVRRWLTIVDAVLTDYGSSAGDDCSNDDSRPVTPRPGPGHPYALASSVALTPYVVKSTLLYKIDVADTSLDRTVAVGVTGGAAEDLMNTLRLAVDAARVLRDDELRRTGPVAVRPIRHVSPARLPRYPEDLRVIGLEGAVGVEFVVDTTGRVNMGTFHVLTSTEPEFTRSVRSWLSHARFSPVSIEGHVLGQRVRKCFTFSH